MSPAYGRCSLNRRPGTALAQQAGQRRLPHLERFLPQVRAVQFEQVEGVQEHVLAFPLAPHAFEHGQAIVVAADGLPIDQAGPSLEVVHGLDDQRDSDRPSRGRCVVSSRMPTGSRRAMSR